VSGGVFLFSCECNFNSVESVPYPGEIADELKFYKATKTGV
jgi:hypothetical protein